MKETPTSFSGYTKNYFNTSDSRVIYKELSKINAGKAHLKAFNKNVKKEYEQMLDARTQKI